MSSMLKLLTTSVVAASTVVSTVPILKTFRCDVVVEKVGGESTPRNGSVETVVGVVGVGVGVDIAH